MTLFVVIGIFASLFITTWIGIQEAGYHIFRFAKNGWLSPSLFITSLIVLTSIVSLILKLKTKNSDNSVVITMYFCAVLFLGTLFIMQSSGNWGPIVFPLENGSQIVTFTFVIQCVTFTIGKNGVNTTYSTFGRRHKLFIPHRQFDLYFEGEKTSYNADKLDSFIFMSDNHNKQSIQKFSKTNVDLILSAGDNANDGFLSNFFEFFKDYPGNKPFLTAMGNHDQRMNEDIFGFDYRNYYTKIDGVGFYFVTVQNKAMNAIVTQEGVDTSIKFIQNNFHYDDVVRILVVHAPMYPARKENGIYYIEEFEKLFDKYKFNYVLSGHTHVFTSFKRNALSLITAGSSGADSYRFKQNFFRRGMEFYVESINNTQSYVKFSRTRKRDDFHVSLYDMETDEEIRRVK
uniref:Fibronectin type III domain protein n=1 Tax=Trepomonas sp. PC1 TaxID=1076344 RepID=A0A146K6X1_9EUKA|eukprot:JAP91585.1 Fibronectin type III domain protein [Trepomonas sp. PC1]